MSAAIRKPTPFSNHALIERHLLGVTREQLGYWLMSLWNMPEEVSSAIRFQNEAAYNKDESSYAHLLFIASRLLREHGIGDAPLEKIPDALFEELYLDQEVARKAIERVMSSAAELKAIASNMGG